MSDATFRTRAGSPVEVNHTATAQVRSPKGAETVTGPTWHCHGCGDHSDEPLGSPAFTNPGRMVEIAAEAHATNCRS